MSNASPATERETVSGVYPVARQRDARDCTDAARELTSSIDAGAPITALVALLEDLRRQLARDLACEASPGSVYDAVIMGSPWNAARIDDEQCRGWRLLRELEQLGALGRPADASWLRHRMATLAREVGESRARAGALVQELFQLDLGVAG